MPLQVNRGTTRFVDCRERISQLCDFAESEVATSGGHPYPALAAFIKDAGQGLAYAQD